jgi:hypothetical protein
MREAFDNDIDFTPTSQSFPVELLNFVLLAAGAFGFLLGLPKEGSTGILSSFFREVNRLASFDR